MLQSLGRLYLLGYNINWKDFDQVYFRVKVSLPSYPFQRKSYWLNYTPKKGLQVDLLLGLQTNSPSTVKVFENQLVLDFVPFLKDHCIGSRIVFPGAGFASMCLAAGYVVAKSLQENSLQTSPTNPIAIKNFKILAPLELHHDQTCILQTRVSLQKRKSGISDSNEGFQYSVTIYHDVHGNSHHEQSRWLLHASATFKPVISVSESMKHWLPGRLEQMLNNFKPVGTSRFYMLVAKNLGKICPTF